jgi:thiol-disulfide isomerase/thioredoxin
MNASRSRLLAPRRTTPDTAPTSPAPSRRGPKRRTISILVAAAIGIALAVAVAIVVAGGGGEAQGGVVQIIPPAERVPLADLAGADVREGQPDIRLGAIGGPTVINVWASWCPPCRTEQRGLELASKQLAGEGVRFVGINVRDDRAAAGAYLDEFGVTYPSVYDRDGRVVQALGREAPQWPPWTLVIDAQGRVAARITGSLPGSQPDAQAAELTRIVTEALR